MSSVSKYTGTGSEAPCAPVYTVMEGEALLLLLVVHLCCFVVPELSSFVLIKFILAPILWKARNYLNYVK